MKHTQGPGGCPVLKFCVPFLHLPLLALRDGPPQGAGSFPLSSASPTWYFLATWVSVVSEFLSCLVIGLHVEVRPPLEGSRSSRQSQTWLAEWEKGGPLEQVFPGLSQGMVDFPAGSIQCYGKLGLDVTFILINGIRNSSDLVDPESIPRSPHGDDDCVW